MKKKLKNSLHVIYTLITIAVIAAACGSKEHADHKDTYICPMHPTVVSDKPATCPVCGMDLVRKARPGEEVAITEDLAKLIKSPNEVVVGSIAVAKGQFKSASTTVEAQGIVTYDTKNIFTISSRVSGRLEKVFLKYNFQPVSKGQRIAEIYSPELITAQRELLFLLENDGNNNTLVEAAKRKLELLGMSSLQVNQLAERKKIENMFAVYSDYSGYLISGTSTTAPPTTTTQMTQPSGNTGMTGGMGSASSSANQSSGTVSNSNDILREGSYVAAGERLFQVVNTNALRVEIDLPATKTGNITKGESLRLDFGYGHVDNAEIDFVQPFFNSGEDFLKVRVVVPNSNDLHIGHIVTAQIQLPSVESLWVPKTAVLDLGGDKIVFIKERTVFKPKKVVTGIISGEVIQIMSGLASSDEFATNAQYLIDSESFIKKSK